MKGKVGITKNPNFIFYKYYSLEEWVSEIRRFRLWWVVFIAKDLSLPWTGCVNEQRPSSPFWGVMGCLCLNKGVDLVQHFRAWAGAEQTQWCRHNGAPPEGPPHCGVNSSLVLFNNQCLQQGLWETGAILTITIIGGWRDIQRSQRREVINDL